MLSVDEARELISLHVRPLPGLRTDLADALGRVLREDAVAAEDIPAFDRSAMDGYALGAADRRKGAALRVVGESRPGRAPAFTVGAGECGRIFTGAAVPEGAGAVVPQEWTERDGDFVTLRDMESEQTFIRHAGEDARPGTVLLEAGASLGPGELALLANLGCTRPVVSSQPRVLHLTTGDELVPPDVTPGPGQIRDTNSTLVAALLARAGARLLAQVCVGDDPEALLQQIRSQADWDLLLISGGASVGDYDFGARTLSALGFDILFSKLNLKPGKPLIFATRGAQTAFVLPGNPVSHFVVFQIAVRLALDRMEGRCGTVREGYYPLDGELRGDGRELFSPARIVAGQAGLPAVQPIAWQSSGDLLGLLRVDALIRTAAGGDSARHGSAVRTILL